MKCPDCNGVIEGKRSFCPHCGRKLGGAPAAGRKAVASSFATGGKAERPTAKNLSGGDAAQARAAMAKMRAAMPSGAEKHAIRIAAFTLIGALIAGALPGHRWLVGAMIGLFLGLPKKTKG